MAAKCLSCKIRQATFKEKLSFENILMAASSEVACLSLAITLCEYVGRLQNCTMLHTYLWLSWVLASQCNSKLLHCETHIVRLSCHACIAVTRVSAQKCLHPDICRQFQQPSKSDPAPLCRLLTHILGCLVPKSPTADLQACNDRATVTPPAELANHLLRRYICKKFRLGLHRLQLWFLLLLLLLHYPQQYIELLCRHTCTPHKHYVIPPKLENAHRLASCMPFQICMHGCTHTVNNR